MTRTKATVEMRRCTGSARFGIDAHEAPIDEFPKQPSRKDGLGTMCAPHWKAYVKGLTDDRKARGNGATPPETPAKPAKAPRATKPKAAAKKPTNGDAVAAAQALIASVEALPGPESTARWGDDDVQAALELVGTASVGAPHETPRGGDEEVTA